MVSLSQHTLEMSIGIRKSRSIFCLVIKPCFENVTYFYFTYYFKNKKFQEEELTMRTSFHIAI
jgi:hypothetical protein